MVRILVVDDNTSMREAVCEMLQQAGYETISVENGRFATQIHRNDPIDIIVTDLFMPETDGLEIIYQFRHEYPDVKIIAVSGGGSRGQVELLTVAKKDLLAAVQELLPSPSSN
jgi:CheY-like chemotaxis protein